MESNRKEASPIEIAALLMDAVCTPTDAEQDALRELATHLQVDLERMQSELMFLRAFAVDFATSMTLGQSRAREEILSRYYQHWERIDREVGGGLTTDLQSRLQLYTENLDSSEGSAADLQGLIGGIFARCCGAAEAEGELVLLGGAMFGALFAEIADLLQEVDIAY